MIAYISGGRGVGGAPRRTHFWQKLGTTTLGRSGFLFRGIPFASQHRDFSFAVRALAHCMNQPWLTTSDCPVNALLSKPAKNTAVSATSATVVNSPSTVSFNITFLTTSSSEMPSFL